MRETKAKADVESVAGFTRGPWRAFGIRCGNMLVRADNSGEDIAEVWIDEPHQRADAHLIAAAPTMYEALRVFVDLQDRGHFALLTTDVEDALDAARAALATATPSPNED